jgi:glycosyltransferase involved in cell wall biosynthesis
VKLLIAIPALNEEASIESIIQRTLAARREIIGRSPIHEVSITVVSDGSTDRTVELARSFEPQIRLIVFEHNRGYGAAIKEAWRQSDAELLSFLDADGTCDPKFFADLCIALEREKADVVLGCRLHAGSKMPAIRRLGNFIFASLLTVFSSRRVRDTASGMRVVRRTCLPRLMPLPNGLHFTPAMSARALLSEDIRIFETDMPYHERAGESKLRVAEDGLRFLRVILNTAFLYRPSRPFGLLGLGCLATGGAFMISPLAFYLRHGKVLEWMIYRFIVSHLLGISGVLLLCAGYLCTRLVKISLSVPPPRRSLYRFLDAFFASPFFWAAPASLAIAGGALVLQSLLELVTTGSTFEHWSRFIAMSFFLSISIILGVTKAIGFVIDLMGEKLEYLRGAP